MEVYKQKDLSIKKRVNDLLKQMTIEEKIGQMIQLPAKEGVAAENFSEKLEEWSLGSFLHCTAEKADNIQRRAKQTNLGIPVIFGIDAIHGHCFEDKGTVFPTQLGLSCSWNRDLVRKIAQITAKEVRACGIHWVFSPVLCVARDPRWGRVDETFGEDPWLIGELASAMIMGYQDKKEQGESVIACAKHFAGYAESTGGRDSYEADISKRKMLSIFLPPFKKAVQEAGVATLMTGYQANNGLPATIDHWLLTEIAKKQWDFKGCIITDWNNVGALYSNQRVVPNLKEAAYKAVMAGNDIMMSTESAYLNLVELVKEGRISEEVIDKAVERILKLKFQLGLFEEETLCKLSKDKVLGTQKHWDTALEASRQSLVLLKNENVLPLNPKTTKRILLAGPNADDISAQLGDWSFGSMQAGITNSSFHKEDTLTLLHALDSAQEEHNFKLDYIKGADVLDPKFDEIDLAREKAKTADIIVVCVGDTLEQHGEGHDRSNLDLSGKQQKLLEALKASGKKLIVILMASKPLTIPWIKKNADAFICCFNPGAKGGLALKEALFGEFNFSGKLTISFPYSTGQLPVFYNKYRGWHCTNIDSKERYIDAPEEPLFCFGEGMSYTSFNYSDLEVLTPVISDLQKASFKITIENTGKCQGTEIVQLYIRDIVSSVTTPMKNLRAFSRLELNPGEKRTILLQVKMEDLAIVTENLTTITEAGEFEVMIGPSSQRDRCLTSIFSVNEDHIF